MGSRGHIKSDTERTGTGGLDCGSLSVRGPGGRGREQAPIRGVFQMIQIGCVVVLQRGMAMCAGGWERESAKMRG